MELSKVNVTKNEELDKSERDYGNNTNLEKLVEDKFLAMDFLECADPVRYKTLWFSLRKKSLITQRH